MRFPLNFLQLPHSPVKFFEINTCRLCLIISAVTAFRMNIYKEPTSVDSKSLTQVPSPLDATLMKNRGRGPVIVN
jgi:hypothetical protein